MPKLQVASPTAWGLERWGKARRTSSVQWPKALALYNGQWRDMATSCNHSLEMATAVVGRGRSRQLFAIGRLGPPRNEKPTPVRGYHGGSRRQIVVASLRSARRWGRRRRRPGPLPRRPPQGAKLSLLRPHLVQDHLQVEFEQLVLSAQGLQLAQRLALASRLCRSGLPRRP